MRQQQCKAWPWGCPCVCKCQGHKPGFIKAWGHHDNLYCLCNSFWPKGGGLFARESKHWKRPQVSVSCENLLAVKSTYALWNPLTCLHCFITQSVVWGELSLNDTVELPPPAVRSLLFASEIDLSFSILLALSLNPHPQLLFVGIYCLPANICAQIFIECGLCVATAGPRQVPLRHFQRRPLLFSLKKVEVWEGLPWCAVWDWCWL